MALSSPSLGAHHHHLPPLNTTHHSSSPKLLFLHPPHFSSSSCNFPIIIRTATTPHTEKWRAQVSFFPAFLKRGGKDANTIKQELLQAIAPLDRGADASPDDQQTVDQIARKLEAVNPTKEPLKSNLLDGKWELIYTTSQSILQTKRPKLLRSVANYQAINVDTLRAQNMESWPFFNQVTANLTPLNARKVAVQFDTFKILGLASSKFHSKLLLDLLNLVRVIIKNGQIPVKAPGRARGELEITYLDEELRVSRGDKGNLFILKMVDPSYRVPV